MGSGLIKARNAEPGRLLPVRTVLLDAVTNNLLVRTGV
jgi:hypothetical protein